MTTNAGRPNKGLNKAEGESPALAANKIRTNKRPDLWIVFTAKAFGDMYGGPTVVPIMGVI